SPELLSLFGIGGEVLPRAVPSRYDYGLLPTPAGPVPLTVVTGDQSAVPFAFGPLDPAIAYVNLGTGAFAQRAVPGALPVAPRLLVSVVWSTSSHVDYLLEGTVNGAGSALDWLADQEGAPLPLLLAEAEAALAAGEAPPLFINGVSGLGAPFWVSSLESRFVGTGSRGARVLAVLESIAFLVQVNLEELEHHGPPIAALLATGGLSANEYLWTCLANVSGLAVRRAEDPEATARGLARLVAGNEAKGWRLPAVVGRTARRDGALRSRYVMWRAKVEAAIAALGAT
ncbi:MAG: FGGY-family carbohydrate kinase, partial [Gammaproteobacteria bacterium]|nr:FGGY-family carbohydrate kinase [Gammaproteobacteria bacterium]